MSNEIRLFFQEYMFLGGVDVSTPAYASEDNDIINVDCLEGTVNDRFYNGQDYWKVDFKGVVSGFLSISAPRMAGNDTDQLELAVCVVENFLRYVFRQGACPEYSEDMTRALRVCKDARQEWPMMESFLAALPGKFSLAAAALFACQLADASSPDVKSMEDSDAKIVFYASLTLSDFTPAHKVVSAQALGVVRRVTCDVEVVSLELPRDEEISFARRFHYEGQTSKARPVPLGLMYAKETTIEDGWYDPAQTSHFGQDEEICIVWDGDLLMQVKIGMKLKLNLCQLSTGLFFVRSVEDLLPTFYNFLPQMLMRQVVLPSPLDKDEAPTGDEDDNAED